MERMGKATALVEDLITRQLSPKEIAEREEAARPRTRLVATLDGQFVEPAPSPQEVARLIQQAPQQTFD
jgi:hypothetical protein